MGSNAVLCHCLFWHDTHPKTGLFMLFVFCIRHDYCAKNNYSNFLWWPLKRMKGGSSKGSKYKQYLNYTIATVVMSNAHDIFDIL